MNDTSEKLKMISADLRAAMEVVGKKHGVSFATGAITYNELYFTFSTKGRMLNAAGSTVEADKAEWDVYCRKFGLTPDMFGKSFAPWARPTRSPEFFPRVASTLWKDGLGSGGKFKFAAESVRFGMGVDRLGIPPIGTMVITKKDVGTISVNSDGSIALDEKKEIV